MTCADARAAGLESIELPDIAKSEWTLGANARSKKILADAEADFQNSDLLSILKDNTEENKDKYALAPILPGRVCLPLPGTCAGG